MNYIKTGIVFIYLLLIGCHSPGTVQDHVNELTAKQLYPMGRVLFHEDKGWELISSASHFGFSFTGDECRISASLSEGQDHNYLQYVLDGVYQERIRINTNDPRPVIIKANGKGPHEAWIYKATEAHTGPVFIQGVSGKNIQPVQRSNAPLIEFIGNSITCGAAADPSEIPCGTDVYHDQHNSYQAYGPRVARALNTGFILSSVSGIGIYRNWNSDGPAMPAMYERSDFQTERKWNFDRYQPAVVSIALGTNDLSNGDGKKPRAPFDSARFVNEYVKFVQQVRSKYNSSRIAILSSPMMNGERRILLQNCLTAVKNEVDRSSPSKVPVALYFFKPMQARGCTGHPNVEDHAKMAEELIPFFRQLIQL